MLGLFARVWICLELNTIRGLHEVTTERGCCCFSIDIVCWLVMVVLKTFSACEVSGFLFSELVNHCSDLLFLFLQSVESFFIVCLFLGGFDVGF